MDTSRLTRRPTLALLLALAALGCDQDAPPNKKEAAKPAPPLPAAAKKAKVGPSVFLEVDGDKRRVLVETVVCLRKGPLELLLTRKRTKEHEAILAFDGDARHIHAALIAAGAEPGKPVQFRPKYQPAHGAAIKVSVRYEDKGKTVETPAQKWIKNVKTGKDLQATWVFGGSFLIPDPLDQTKPPFYAANDGSIISLSNFAEAMLDLPFSSPDNNDALFYEAHTDRIPAMDARVWVVLEPVRQNKKQ